MSSKTDAELTAAADVIAAETAAGANTRGRVAGLLKDIIDSKPNNPVRGNYDASTNLFPEIGGTGGSGVVLRGNQFPVTVGGTLNGEHVPAGSILFALDDQPDQDALKWRVI